MQKGRTVLSYLSSRILCIILSTIIVVHYYTCRNILVLQWIESHLGGLAKNIGITDRLIWNSTMSKYVYGICYVFILHWLHMHPMSNQFMITHSEFHHKGGLKYLFLIAIFVIWTQHVWLLVVISSMLSSYTKKYFHSLTNKCQNLYALNISYSHLSTMSLFFRLIVYFEIGKVSLFL